MSTSNSAVVRFEPGADVSYRGQNCTVVRIIDLESVLLRVRGTEENQIKETLLVAKIKDVLPPLTLDLEAIPSKQRFPDVTSFPEKILKKIELRMSIIRPLLDTDVRNKAMVKSRAQEFGIGVATLYRWIRAYEETGVTTSLISISRKDKGGFRLAPEVVAIIKSAIEEIYLTPQKKTARKVVDEVRRKCLSAKLDAPHSSTIRRHLAEVPLKRVISKRSGKEGEYRQFVPLRGEFPNADGPYAVIQIDHTKVDLILVDDIHRKPIGRPWITLAIDVFSRMVAGMTISLDPPGSMATGLCMAHAILSKEDWLSRLGIKNPWPCRGLMRTIHMDNAREFRGRMLEGACQKYGIDIEFRPVKQPHFGGHIERLIGTFMKEIHDLPGTTFSNPKEKGQYDPEAKAAMTLGEFEQWLATFITGVYHVRTHSALGISPLEKYRQGILGDGDHPGTGLPPKILDEHNFRLDFMPYIERTIQEYGVAIDGIRYYRDVLNPWINALLPGKGKIKRKFMFRRDPRDISKIWFLDPELNEYFEIPYRNTSLPSVSLWDLKESRRRLKEEGHKIDERSLFETYDRLNRIEEQAVEKSKKARRKSQSKRERLASKKSTPTSGSSPEVPASPETLPSPGVFEEIVELGDG